MSDISSGADPLKDIIEQMKRDAFASGWNAAIEAVNAAIAGIQPPEGGDAVTSGSFGFQARVAPATNSQSMPTVGTTPWFVMQAVQKKQGMTGAQIIDAVRAEGHAAAEPQIRTALSRLATRQLLANRHRKWFLK